MVQRSIELTPPGGGASFPDEFHPPELPEDPEEARPAVAASHSGTESLTIESSELVAVNGLNAEPVKGGPWHGKRVFDIVGVLLIGALLSPFILIIWLCLLVSPGPVLFGHKRVGRDGVLFTCYKFRTMIPNAEQVLAQLLMTQPELRAQWQADHKLMDDPRVTRFGKFLRKTSLDELPQLWNVLKGDMSLVGPRPIVQEEMLHYGNTIRYYLAVRPGITGLWQVSGRNDTAYEDRVILDRAYVLSACFAIDLGILLGTISLVLRRSGAY